MGLSKKQRVFVEAYLTTWNATEAARKAGYSRKSARSIGSENLTKPDIQTAIQARIAELKVSADEVLLRLGDIARIDMRDFVSVSADGKPYIDLPRAQKTGKLRQLRKVKHTIETRTFGEETVVRETIEIEPYDKQGALNTLAKHHALLTDRLEIDWKLELRNAGYDPDAKLEQLTDEFKRHLLAGSGSADARGVDAGAVGTESAGDAS